MEANRKTVVTSSAEREPAADCGCGSLGETSRAADAAGGGGAPGAWRASTPPGGPPRERARAPAGAKGARKIGPRGGGGKKAEKHTRPPSSRIDVVDRDRAPIAVVSDQNGEPDGRFRRRHGEYQQRVDLADQIAEEG